MTTELSPALATPLTTVADENIGIHNGVAIKSNGVLTELDRVSPTFYKRQNMPSAFGIVEVPNGTNNNGPTVEVLCLFTSIFFFWDWFYV